MMTLTDSIKANRAAVRAATEACSRLQELADAHAKAVKPDTAPGLPSARQAYEDACAAHALGEIGDAALTEARADLSAAEESYQATATQRSMDEAVQAGIQRRLAQAMSDLQQATEAEKASLVAWAEAELEAADTDYVRHGLAAASAMCRVEALKSWLKSQGISKSPRAAFSADLGLPPLAQASLAAVLEARPGLRGSIGDAWQSNLYPRFEPAAASAVLQAEMDAITAEAPAASGSSKLIASARRLVRGLAQSHAGGAA